MVWRLQGAIIAGALVAFSVFLLLGSLGTAVGLSASGGGRFGVAAAIWTIVVSLVSLFLGGWVAGQFAIGESQGEAALYGVILWGVVFFALLMLSVAGVNMGLGAMVGSNGGPMNPSDFDRLTTGMGLTEVQIQGLRQNLSSPPRSDASSLAWWTFFSILISMASSVLGGITGSATRGYVFRAGPLYRTTPVTR